VIKYFQGEGRFRGWLIAILVVALLVRVAAVLATRDYVPATDAADYQRHAVSIESGHGYPQSQVARGGGPTAFRPPLYPYFLAGVYTVTGTNLSAARLAQALLGVLVVALIGLLAHMIWGRRTALISMAIASVYPPLLITGAALISESLFLPVEMVALVAAVVSRRAGGDWRWAVLAGLFVGLATLARPNGFVLVLPVCAAVLIPRRTGSRRSALIAPATVLGVALVAILPWTIRNAVEMHSFIPVSTQAGYTLSGTYNAVSDHDSDAPAAWRVPSLVPEYRSIFASDSRLNEVQTEKRIREGAIDYIQAHPAYVLKAGFWNTVRLFDLTGFTWGEQVARDSGISPAVADLGIVSFWAVGLLALVGCFTRRARSAPLFFWITIGVLILSVVFISGTSRYRAPLEPFVVILAALAIEDGWERVHRLRAAAAKRPVSGSSALEA
jgi:4-amino-4-deoxy-L-arabinose transferase-like glycosyltransferase